MARTGWGRHTVVATGSNDTTKQVSVNAWNNDLDTDGIIGFAPETVASASSVTPTNSYVKLSGSTSVDTIALANSSDGDLLYVITTGSVTLNNTSSPSTDGDIRLLGDDDKDLSTTTPTILIRNGAYWYEYGGSPVTDGSIANAQLADMAANTIKVRNANSSGVPSDIALATTQLLIGDGTGFTAAALSGDVTMDNTGDVTVGTLNQSTTGNAATVTTNADLTGDVTSSGNATTIATDAVDLAMLSATGTASSSTFLRGDNSWTAVTTYSAPTIGSTSIGSGATVATIAGLTLTSPVVNTQITGTAVLDSDTMSGANATTISTSESIKAYVDSQDHNISDGEVTNAKLANMAGNTIKVRNASDAGVPSDVAVATTQILIGDGTGFTVAALSGDATMTNAGAVTIATLNQDTTGSSASCTGNSVTATTATTATNVALTNEYTDTTCFPLFVNSTGSIGGVKTNTAFTYNSNTANLTAITFTGALVGNASTATTAAGLSATLAVASGGTYLTSYAVGDVLYASGTTAISKLAKPGTPAGEVLTFAVGASAPSWAAGGGGAHTEQEWTVYDPASFTPTPAVANTEAYMYTEEIDSDNDGLFIQMWKNGASQAVQIA